VYNCAGRRRPWHRGLSSPAFSPPARHAFIGKGRTPTLDPAGHLSSNHNQPAVPTPPPPFFHIASAARQRTPPASPPATTPGAKALHKASLLRSLLFRQQPLLSRSSRHANSPAAWVHTRSGPTPRHPQQHPTTPPPHTQLARRTQHSRRPRPATCSRQPHLARDGRCQRQWRVRCPIGSDATPHHFRGRSANPCGLQRRCQRPKR